MPNGYAGVEGALQRVKFQSVCLDRVACGEVPRASRGVVRNGLVGVAWEGPAGLLRPGSCARRPSSNRRCRRSTSWTRQRPPGWVGQAVTRHHSSAGSATWDLARSPGLRLHRCRLPRTRAPVERRCGAAQVLAGLPRIPHQPQPYDRHRQSRPHLAAGTLRLFSDESVAVAVPLFRRADGVPSKLYLASRKGQHQDQAGGYLHYLLCFHCVA
jgi:hypothetical protein